MMEKKISKKQLQQLVESEVDEAWAKSVAPFIAAGSLLTAPTAIERCTDDPNSYQLPKTETNYSQEPSIDDYRALTKDEYYQWIKERDMPDNIDSQIEFENSRGFYESRRNYLNKRRIVESIVRQELAKALNEDYSNQVDLHQDGNKYKMSRQELEQAVQMLARKPIEQTHQKVQYGNFTAERIDPLMARGKTLFYEPTQDGHKVYVIDGNNGFYYIHFDTNTTSSTFSDDSYAYCICKA